MSFRKILFWSHLVTGVGAGLIVLVLAVTGVLLTYETQITRWAESGFGVSVAGEMLPADRLAEAAFVETGGTASALIFENDPEVPVIAASGRSDKAFLDPYNGAVLAAEATRTQDFFAAVTSLHRWLSVSGRSETGAAMTGASNLLFGFLLLSGAYLWLPRIWRWGILKTKILFRRSYPNSKARDFAWHHVFGFWAAIPLFLIILSGVVISYGWASNLVFAAYGEEPAMRGGPPGGQGKGSGRGLGMGRLGGGGGGHGDHEDEGGTFALAPGSLALQAVLETAQAHDPDWNRITLNLPKDGASEVTAIVDTGTSRQLSRQETLTVSLESADVVGTSSLADRSPGAQARLWMRYVHTGELYGVIGQTIAGLASLASVFMVYTGLALSYRRLVVPLFRRHRAGPVAMKK